MSNSSDYTESFLTVQSDIPGAKLIENLRNEMKSSNSKVAGKIKELENKIGELENKVETQELKIVHLEKMLDEKFLENEMQKVKINWKNNPASILKASPKILVQKENFGLSIKTLKALSEYGCIGHNLDDDKGKQYGGLNWTDKTCFALLVKAIKNGLNQFTLKFGGISREFTIGNAKLIYSNEKIKLDGSLKWIRQLSITLDGRQVRFKASCQVMDAVAGYELKKYEFKETNSDGLYEQVILRSDLEATGGAWFTRFHVTIIN